VRRAGHRRDFTVPGLHPLYEAHRPQMEEVMRQRFDFADPLLREHLHLSDTSGLRQEIMDEFQTVLRQMPYVGGAESRMSDFSCGFSGSWQSDACCTDTACPQR